MNKLLPLTLLALLLSGCSDSKLPKPPPKVPEPKLMSMPFYAGPSMVLAWNFSSSTSLIAKLNATSLPRL
jgi:hypothetical protein